MGAEALKSEEDAAVVMVDEAEARMTCTHTHTNLYNYTCKSAANIFCGFSSK